MAQILADSNAMRSSSAQIKSDSTKMEEILANVKAEFNSISNVWTGSKADEVNEVFNEATSYFPQFKEAVDDVAKFLDDAAAIYDEANR